MNYKLFNYISYGTIIVALLFMVTVFYWLLFPYKPIEFPVLPHFVENKQVLSGEYLIYYVEYCKYSKVTPIADKTFNDGIIYSIPQVIATEKSIGCGTSKIQIYIPRGLPKGKYFIESTYRYKMNPLRTIDVKTKTEQFEVI